MGSVLHPLRQQPTVTKALPLASGAQGSLRGGTHLLLPITLILPHVTGKEIEAKRCAQPNIPKPTGVRA